MKMVSEELSCSVGQGSFKIDCFKVKTCSMVRRFQQDNAKPHTEAITTAWLHSGIVRVLNWPDCNPDLSPIENIWHIIKRKIHQRRPQTLQQLETYSRQEWDQIIAHPAPLSFWLICAKPFAKLSELHFNHQCNDASIYLTSTCF